MSESGPSTPAALKLALTREEAAQALGLSLRKLDELIAHRDSGLPIVRVGKKVIFPVAALDRWLSDRVGKTV